MANTKIVIKRSSGTATPTTLASGELAYSYSSNNAFIGSPTGDGALPIGGYNTYTAVNNATTANTASTIVKRDANGAFSGQLYGNSNTATALQTSRNFSISGGDIAASVQGFDGTGAVVLNASLNTVAGLSAGYYGGTTAVPVVQVSANGRIMSISNTTIATSFTVTGNTGSGSQAGGGTLTVEGSNGLSTTVSGTGGNETIVITPDNTFVRTTGNQGINGDLSITGNLVINGTTTTVNTATVTTTDSLIKLAANNTVGDIVDIGYYGSYNSSGVKYARLIREGSGGSNPGNFYLFRDLATDPTGNVVNYAGLTSANLIGGLLNSTIYNGTINSLATDLAVADGGTGQSTFTSGQIIIGNGTGGLQQIANVSTTVTGTLTSNNTITSFTTDAWGRVTAYTGAAISILGGQVTTAVSHATNIDAGGANQLPYQTGAGATSFVQAPGSADITYSTQILTATAAGVPVWTTTLDGGSF